MDWFRCSHFQNYFGRMPPLTLQLEVSGQSLLYIFLAFESWHLMCGQQCAGWSNIGLGIILVTFSEASQCGNTGGDRVLNVCHRRSLRSDDSVFARSNSQNFLWRWTSSGKEEDFMFPARTHPCNNVRMNGPILNYKQLRRGCGLLQKLSWTLEKDFDCDYVYLSMMCDKILWV